LDLSLGKITLLDFKEALKVKTNSYRFHFKTQDPEFGIVKEEIANDATVLPGYENKIISWIQDCD
jgi:segment polarity protein dishevelled